MAEFTGITADKADEILGMSVVSGTVNASGHLILTRANGQTIDAGDFTAIVTDVLDDTVNAAVVAAVPAYIVGTTVDKGNLTGVVTFPTLNNVNIVNALVKCIAVGNLSIDVGAMPSAPKPNTQFAFKIQQDSTGSRLLTLTGFKRSQGTLVLTTTPNAIDILVFLFDGTNWYAGLMGVDFR